MPSEPNSFEASNLCSYQVGKGTLVSLWLKKKNSLRIFACSSALFFFSESKDLLSIQKPKQLGRSTFSFDQGKKRRKTVKAMSEILT